MVNKIQVRKNFIKKNDGFVCLHCAFVNPFAQKTCRNHCIKCLYSLHVDEQIPGDRLSLCQGLMKPIQIEQDGKKGFTVRHLCLKCKKEICNKLAEDDSWETVCRINVF